MRRTSLEPIVSAKTSAHWILRRGIAAMDALCAEMYSEKSGRVMGLLRTISMWHAVLPGRVATHMETGLLFWGMISRMRRASSSLLLLLLPDAWSLLWSLPLRTRASTKKRVLFLSIQSQAQNRVPQSCGIWNICKRIYFRLSTGECYSPCEIMPKITLNQPIKIQISKSIISKLYQI